MIKRHHFDVVHSTNDLAKEHLRRQSPRSQSSQSSQVLQSSQTMQPFAITADVQTGGRGRNGKSWHGAAGENVYCSVGIQHSREPSLQELVTFQAVGCLAAKAACEELTRTAFSGSRIATSVETAPTFRIKYPNDVYALQTLPSGIDGVDGIGYGIKSRLQARKICGVLVEHEFAGSHCTASVIGIGLNVRQMAFPAELARKASSLLALGIDTTAERTVELLLRCVELLLKQRSDAVFKAWREELAIEGASVQLAGESGWRRVASLLDDGRLCVVNPANGEERIISNGDSILMDWQQDA